MYKNFNFLLLSTDYNHSKKFGPISGPTKCVGLICIQIVLTPLWYLCKIFSIFYFFFFGIKADDKNSACKNTQHMREPKLAGINHHNIYMYQLKHDFYIKHISGLKMIWASTRENLSSGVCEQHMRRPACASMQSDQRLCY